MKASKTEMTLHRLMRKIVFDYQLDRLKEFEVLMEAFLESKNTAFQKRLNTTAPFAFLVSEEQKEFFYQRCRDDHTKLEHDFPSILR